MSHGTRRLTAAGRRTTGSVEATWELPLGAPASGQARVALRGWLAAAGIDPLGSPGADIVLAASELAANAALHGLPPVLLTARLAGDGGQVVTVRVSDVSTKLPQLAPSPELAEHGRGLAIVAALALGWGTSQTPGGKETWFEIAVPAPAESASSGPTRCHNDPFGMNGEVSHGPARREVQAS